MWKYYLKPWCKNEQIYCLREKKIFLTHLNNVANSRDFYRLKELGKNEIYFLERSIARIQSPILRELDLNWIRSFSEVFMFRKKIIEKGIKDYVLDGLIENSINNLEEEFHARIENTGIKYLNKILEKDLSFYDTDDELIEFNFFLCMQYFRTENLKMRVLEAMDKENEYKMNMENVWTVMKILYATNMACTLFVTKEEWHIQLLVNETNHPFITGDQPVVNEYAMLGVVPTDLSLYYPVSPYIALRISKKHIDNSIHACQKNDIKYLNSLIYKNSYQQIYANSEFTLRELL